LCYIQIENKFLSVFNNYKMIRYKDKKVHVISKSFFFLYNLYKNLNQINESSTGSSLIN